MKDHFNIQKPKVVIDYETKSDVDLLSCGRYNYFHGKEADLLMMSYKIENEPTKLWLPGEELPDFAKHPNDYALYAHSAEFEYMATNILGKKYGFAPVDISNFTCIMALCGRYGLPQSLEKAGLALGCDVIKAQEGLALIKLFCTPEHNYGRDLHDRTMRWNKFKEYCITDTESEAEVLSKLPSEKLSPDERWNWLHSCLVNARGIPIDYESVVRIKNVSNTYRNCLYEILPGITDGKITKITQVKRIIDWVNSKGIYMENCQAETIQDMLVRDDLPEDVTMLLEMRAAIGLSSIGKYVRMQDHHHNGRIYDNQRYYGTHTGRWTGNGVQLLNLPRAKVADPEAEIRKFFTGDITEENPVMSARALIRPMIKAPEGQVIMAADYSSIEYVMLEWFAGAQRKLDRFVQDFDQYIDQASFMYKIGYDLITASQRQDGKIVVLGCGYGLGWQGLIRNAEKQWGMILSPEQAQFMVNGYRADHKEVVNMWYKCKDAMLLAIDNPGVQYATHKCKFKHVKDRNGMPWLMLILPSGRALYYNKPFIRDDTFGPAPCHYGLDPTTKVWAPRKIIPGRIVENIVQAAARDVLTDGMMQCEEDGFKIIWSIYDEIVVEEPEATATERLQQLCLSMCTVGNWAKGIPLRADGFFGPRYKKM